jgi:hypothetical protein
VSRVLKYPLKPLNSPSVVLDIEVPTRFLPLCAQMQDGKPMMWAAVEETETRGRLVVHCRGTGHADVPEGAEYLSTIQDHDYVWHLFYTRRRRGGGVLNRFLRLLLRLLLKYNTACPYCFAPGTGGEPCDRCRREDDAQHQPEP